MHVSSFPPGCTQECDRQVVTFRLLLAEDEPSLARGLLDNFRAASYEVSLVTRGDEVLAAIERFLPDILVLDIMLPARSGLEVLRELRRRESNLPVLLLTAKSDIVDRVVGLELGADDYLPKPFAVRELLARVHALLRRSRTRTPPIPPRGLVLEGVRFDFGSFTAVGPNGPLSLTTHDLLVLKVLAERRGETVSRADIIEEVAGLDSEATLRSVDNHIVALRRHWRRPRQATLDPYHPRNWLLPLGRTRR